MNSRLEILLRYYKEEPHDPFNVYALATEYLKTDTLEARRLFEELMLQHENYVPTYYHAAKLYEGIGDRGRAIQAYEKGMTIAKQQNDTKALRELRSAYDELMF